MNHRLLLKTIATAILITAGHSGFAATDSYQIQIDQFPSNAKSIFVVTQAGNDVPAKNPGKQIAQFDILPTFKKSAALVTIPVLTKQKDLAKTQFDTALIYQYRDDFGKKYLIVDCPNMIPGQVNKAVEMKITPAQSKFVANEALASFKGLMTESMYQESQSYLTTAIQNFMDHKAIFRACNDDRGGIFDVNAPVSKEMNQEIFAQIGKLAKQWWTA